MPTPNTNTSKQGDYARLGSDKLLKEEELLQRAREVARRIIDRVAALLIASVEASPKPEEVTANEKPSEEPSPHSA